MFTRAYICIKTGSKDSFIIQKDKIHTKSTKPGVNEVKGIEHKRDRKKGEA